MDSYQQKTPTKTFVKNSLSNSNKKGINTSSSDNNKPEVITKRKTNPKFIFGILSLVLLVIGGLVGLYLTSINQDLRQQAFKGITDPYKGKGECTQCVDEICVAWDPEGPFPGNDSCELKGSCKEDGFVSIGGVCRDPSKFECDKDNITACNGNPSACHCLGGDDCTGTKCEPDLEENCTGQGRSYCDNHQDFGKTCCFPGYVCREDEPGCFGEPEPTKTTTTITPSPTTPPNATPTPTTPIGPQCHNIEMYSISTDGWEGRIDQLMGDDDSTLIPGESTVRFVCSNSLGGNLPEGYFYAFRVYEPCQSPNHFDPLEFLNNEGENGVNYPIEYEGDYQAQCAVCTVDSAGDNVCDWEALTVNSCED